jgi:hypothetical protein
LGLDFLIVGANGEGTFGDPDGVGGFDGGAVVVTDNEGCFAKT